jgi:hypothetical protein
MTSFFSKFKTRIGIWILVLTYSSGFLVLTPQLFTFIPAKPEPLFLIFNRKLEQNLMPQVQAEEVVGMTGTIVFNQTSELTLSCRWRRVKMQDGSHISEKDRGILSTSRTRNRSQLG